jgi:Fur family transcriptional regulator, ferric uptake regulator
MFDPSAILHAHNLMRTSCREGILSVIMKAGEPLSEQQIRERLEGNYDRTTFYRSFKVLQERKIIHKIVIDNQFVKYALDNTVTHKSKHAHFYCEKCDSVKCLDSTTVNTPELPDGFVASCTEMIIRGTCNACKVS